MRDSRSMRSALEKGPQSGLCLLSLPRMDSVERVVSLWSKPDKIGSDRSDIRRISGSVSMEETLWV